ncbi:MAG: M23 family metallopeptidase [Bacteroidota bacterium]
MFSSSRLILLIGLAFLMVHCQKEETLPPSSGPNGPPPPEQSFPITYQVDFPEGKFPYPHHDPAYTEEDHQRLIQDVFIINNFGQYQCGDLPEDCYFHDGLDFVLDNGTPIYALQAGTVRANIGGDQYYRSLVVEDLEAPEMAWVYTHVYHFNVAVGERVRKGQFLGRVNFQGIEHIHLTRSRLRSGGAWNNFSDLISLFPDDYFILRDETPPVILHPFHFFKNGTNELIDHGAVDTISGAVDIVVSMRDPGDYTRGWLDNNFYGERLCVKKINYRILHNGEELLSKASFDFSQIEFVFSPDRWREAAIVFKHHDLLEPEAGNFNRFHSHYIITNARDSVSGFIEPSDSELAWNTTATDENGQPLFPNGPYQIEVTAYDTHENATTKTDEVFLQN